MRTITYALMLWATSVYGQTCAQQPPPSLDRISEWSCKDMSYDQAWDLLVANQIPPVRNAKITDLGLKANYGSRKSRLIRGLQITGFATALIGGFLAGNGNLQDWQIGALIAGPKVTEEGVKFFGGAPEQFRETPNEAGFVTIYSLYSNRLIAGSIPAAVPAQFKGSIQLTDWHTLLVEARHKQLQRLEMNQAELLAGVL